MEEQPQPSSCPAAFPNMSLTNLLKRNPLATYAFSVRMQVGELLRENPDLWFHVCGSIKEMDESTLKIFLKDIKKALAIPEC